MITAQKQELTAENTKERLNVISFEFRGLSDDDKPVNTYNGTKIANGSVFIEIDTEDIYFYDEENSEWKGVE